MRFNTRGGTATVDNTNWAALNDVPTTCIEDGYHAVNARGVAALSLLVRCDYNPTRSGNDRRAAGPGLCFGATEGD
jgi:hypothetical protein